MNSTGLKAAAAIALAIVPTASGCRPPQKPRVAGRGPSPAANTVSAGQLTLTIHVPKRDFALGEEVPVTVVARNLAKKPVRFTAPTNTICLLRIWRHNGLAWEHVKRYPPAEMRTQLPWKLDAQSSRTINRRVVVEPDWPTGEVLRLTAELNGRGKLAPGVSIRIRPRAEQ